MCFDNFRQEQERPVGVLTSSVYGKRIRQPIEPLNRDFGRVNHVQADFYRKNDIPSLKAPGFGHMAPAWSIPVVHRACRDALWAGKVAQQEGGVWSRLSPSHDT